MDDSRREVLDHFRARRGDMVAAIERLVAVESPSADIPALQRCAEELAGYLNEVAGARPRLLYAGAERRPHLRVDFGDRTDVLLLGHFDTVHPVGSLAEHPTRVDGDRLYGLGAADMKGGLVVVAEVLAWLRGQHSAPNVTIFFNSDEEIGSPTSALMIRELAVDAGVVLDFEFTTPDGELKAGRRGARQFIVTVKGKGGHAAYPEINVNPVDALADVIVAARAYHDPPSGIIVVPTVLQGGPATNVVPDEAVVRFDVRGTTDEQLEVAEKGIERISLADERLEIHVERITAIPSFPLRRDNRALALARAAARSLGLPEPGAIEARGASDANQAALVNPHVLDGLGGWGDGAHSPAREHLHISSLAPSAAIAALIVERALADRRPDHIE